MVYQLSTNDHNNDGKTDLEELQALRATFPELNQSSYSDNLNYFTMYQLVLDFINAYEQTNVLTDNEKITKIWLEGVVGVNQGVGEQSDFIRNYNREQKELRYGESITDLELNQASDKIALNVIDRIINQDRLVGIEELAGEDVAVVSTDHLNSDDAAWAGNPLLLALNYDEAFNDNILGATDPTYELLATMKVSFDLLDDFSGDSNLLTFFDSDVWLLLSGAAGIAIEADAIQTINNARSASSTMFGNAYDIGLISVTFSEIIVGSKGDDIGILGTNVDDLIHAGDGNDTIIASLDSDILDGGVGNDTVDYTSVGRTIFNVKDETSTAGFKASATIVNGQTSGSGVAVDKLFGIENIKGSNEDDAFLITDVKTSLSLDDNDGTDTIQFNDAAGGGNDQIEGGSSTDIFVLAASGFDRDTITDDVGVLEIGGKAINSPAIQLRDDEMGIRTLNLGGVSNV